MAHEVKIPSGGEGVTTAFVTRWHAAHGDSIQQGDSLVTIDDDKASTELVAEAAGVLEIVVAEGDEVAVGALIGRIC